MIKIGMMLGERYEILEKIGTGGKMCIRDSLLTGTWKFGLIIALIVPIIVACYLPICEWLSKHFPVVCGKLKI